MSSGSVAPLDAIDERQDPVTTNDEQQARVEEPEDEANEEEEEEVAYDEEPDEAEHEDIAEVCHRHICCAFFKAYPAIFTGSPGGACYYWHRSGS